MFHTDKDQLQFIADIADKNNSGADVPMAKIVNPMKRGDNLNILAILTLELISLSAENHNKNSHINSMITARSILHIYKNKQFDSKFSIKKIKFKEILVKGYIMIFSVYSVYFSICFLICFFFKSSLFFKCHSYNFFIII
jgi:hypothetical protein